MKLSFKCHSCVGLLMLIVGLPAWLPGQEGSTAAEIKKQQERFEAELLNVNKPLEMLQAKYRGYLTKQKAAYQAAGQLEAMLAVEDEIQSLTSGGDLVLSTFPDLKRLQEIYRTQRVTTLENMAKTKLDLVQSFQKNADDLAAHLTKAGKIDEAKLALAEAKRLAVMSQDPTLIAALPKPATPDQTPKMSGGTADKSDKGFTNSLGMKFLPVPDMDALVGIHEVRWKDYAEFAKENPSINSDWKNQTTDGFTIKDKAEDHPVVRVNWEDAQAFCRWLSKKEKRTYRLLTDEEWSKAVGIARKEDKKGTPQEKNNKVVGEYPWGSDFPPPQGAGNYSDQSRKDKAPTATAKYLEGYDDGFPTTAPVMSFKPNQFGLYDLGGNVWEWVEDLYNSEQSSRVLRGGSWDFGYEFSLRSSFRFYCTPTLRLSIIGFRVVCEVGPVG